MTGLGILYFEPFFSESDWQKKNIYVSGVIQRPFYSQMPLVTFNSSLKIYIKIEDQISIKDTFSPTFPYS